MLSPALLARTVTGNPALTKTLIQGFEAPQGSTAFTRAMAALVSQETAANETARHWTEGQKQVYTDPKAHVVIDPASMAQPEFQFIPSDTVQQNAAAAQQQGEPAPQAQPIAIQ